MSSSITTRTGAVVAGASSARMSRRPGGRFGRHQVVRAAADQRDRDRASHAPVALPGVRDRTTASLPAGVAGSAFGPRLRAAIVTLTARNRISRRGIAELAASCSARGCRPVAWTRSASTQHRAGRPTRDAARKDARPGRATTSMRPDGGPPGTHGAVGHDHPRSVDLRDRRATATASSSTS